MKKSVTFDEEKLEQILLIPTNRENKTGTCITCCFYSSLIFITNIVYAYLEGYYYYSFLFFCLLCTSLLVHSNIHRNITVLLDKIPIIGIVIYGGYIFYKKCLTLDGWSQYTIAAAIIITFLSTIFLYYYGYLTNQFCYCEDETQAYYYHSALHIIASIGHNLIIYL